MAVREWVLKGPLVFVIITVALASAGVHEGWTLVVYPVLAGWWLINFILLLADGRRQTVWDKLLNAVVINDHDRRFAPKNARLESPPARQFSEDRAW